MKHYKVEIYKDKKKEWRFRVMHKNGREICKSSEGYKRRATMTRIIAHLFDYFIVEVDVS